MRFFRYGIFKRHSVNNQSSNATFNLLWNYMIVFVRSAKRNFTFYSINLTGLVLGLTVVLFALLYIKNETTYDSFHTESDKIYRIAAQRSYGPWFPSIELAEGKKLLTENHTWMAEATFFSRMLERYVTVDGKKFAEPNVLLVESGDKFFEIFDFKIIGGNSKELTKNTNSIVISESLARKYFGFENPVGKSVHFDSINVKISGVFEDLPTNTHVSLDLLLVSNTYFASKASGLFYFRLNGNDTKLVRDAVLGFSDPEKSQLDVDEEESLIDVQIQNIKDIHLGSNLTFELKPGGDKTQLKIFGLVAFVILLISCSNFTNLSNAIFSKRRKEMAVRKVLGSKKSSLTLQFLLESIIMAIIGLVIAYIISFYLLPFFSQFTGIGFTIKHLFDPYLLSISIVLTVITGLLSGLYPSLIMPQIKILSLFKNDFRTQSKINVRKSLVTVQFFLLIGLGSSSFIINQQLTYLTSLDSGLKKEGVVKLKKAWSLQGSETIKSFKNKLLSQSYILNVSQGYVPGDEDYTMSYLPEGFEYPLKDALTNTTDLNYLALLGVEGKHGPFFDEEQHPDVSLLVNETFVKNLGWDDPIGKKINIRPDAPEPRYREVRGVFSDYNFFSFHQQVTPQMIFMRENLQYVNQNILVKINMAHAKESFEWIEKVWDEYQPDIPLNYAFIEDDMQYAYEKDRRTANTSKVLAFLATLLSILGLVGITAFLTTLKTKEIGIRKILGATTGNLLLQFSREYFSLIAIATLSASLLSYTFLNSWLENFAYRININPVIFLFAGFLLAIIAFITVSLEGLKVIRENPTKALRHE